jgi:hypothetical protein
MYLTELKDPFEPQPMAIEEASVRIVQLLVAQMTK